MRAATVTVVLLKVPLAEPYMAAGKQINEYWHALARILSDDGIEGFVYVVTFSAALVKPLADATRELADLLKGMHVFVPEASWAKLRGRRTGWPGGFVNCAIAPLDIAVWDAAAKAVNQPLYRLLGGSRDRVPVYASDNLWYSLSVVTRRFVQNSTTRRACVRTGGEIPHFTWWLLLDAVLKEDFESEIRPKSVGRRIHAQMVVCESS